MMSYRHFLTILHSVHSVLFKTFQYPKIEGIITGNTYAVISQTSNCEVLAFSHFLINFFKDLKFYYSSIVFCAPQLSTLEKSFPVPIGIIPIGAKSGLIPKL